MSGPRAKHDLFRYWQRLLKAMDLGAWEIDLEDGDPDTPDGSAFSADADVQVNPHGLYATIRIAQHLVDDPRPDHGEYVRRVFTHEALHLVRRDSDAMVYADLKSLLGEVGDALFWRSYNRAREREIEAMARLLAPHLPLPPWAAPTQC